MTSGQEFSVEVRRDGEAVVVAPHGELDLGSVDQLRAALRRHDFVHCRAVVLDLSGVSFLDSSGLSLVLQEHQRCECDGLDFQLVPGPETVQRVFEMTGLAEHLVWLNPVDGTAPDGN